MSEHFDAIIIGAGIIGAATAYEMAKQGWKTLNVDKLPAAGYGSTSNSCAIIRTYYSTLDGCALALEGYHYWKQWPDYLATADELGLAAFIECGSVVVKTEHNGYLRRILQLADELGIPYQEWEPAAIQQRLPIWDVHRYGPVRRPDDAGFGEAGAETIAGGVFFPQSGYINDPQLATHNLQRAAEARGARFRFNSAVSTIRQQGGRVRGVVLADGTELSAPVVVNIAGPHSAKINELAGITTAIKTRALRHEVPHVPSPADFNYETQGLVTSDSDVGCYTRPASGGRILIGSEDPPCDTREWVDPDAFDRNLSEQSQVQAMRLGQRIPSLGIPNQIQGVVDLYDVSDDWIPIYDKTELPGFYLAIGTSGNQFKNAPVAGAMMAHLIQSCEQGQDHDRDPVSFNLRHIGREISIGFYSRNRKINKNSSFSVLG